jgi:hypothetical protein
VEDGLVHVESLLERAVVDDPQDAEGPSSGSSAAMEPETPSRAQSGSAAPIGSAALFPPGLYPVRDGGEGDEDPMVAPGVPNGGSIG